MVFLAAPGPPARQSPPCDTRCRPGAAGDHHRPIADPATLARPNLRRASPLPPPGYPGGPPTTRLNCATDRNCTMTYCASQVLYRAVPVLQRKEPDVITPAPASLSPAGAAGPSLARPVTAREAELLTVTMDLLRET